MKKNKSIAKPVVLIVDDEKNTREGLQKAFRHKYDILLADSAENGLEILGNQTVDIVLTDLRMPGMDGLSFIRRVSTMHDAPLIILFTAYGNVQTAVGAMKEGAYDYLTKPLDLDNLEMVVDRGLETRRLRDERDRLRTELDRKYGVNGVIGESPAIIGAIESVRQVASAKSTVLLTGESGTGKEVMAHAIHQLSPRAKNPFVVVHCGALNPNLLESELFGHEKGAFTGAVERQRGRFEMAHGGTIFMDEIGEIDASTQIKLLRVLETRTFERVGGGEQMETDARVIAATNKHLKKLVDEGKFREDLYYRLNVVTINVPPLRERGDDVALLLNHYLEKFAEENGRSINGFSKEAIKLLTAYSWPGNVRELRNCVERMVVMSRGTTLTIGDVPVEVRSAIAEDYEPGSQSKNTTNDLNIDHQEKNLIIKALRDCGGNRTHAAEKLGISRRTLHRKLKAYDLGDF